MKILSAIVALIVVGYFYIRETKEGITKDMAKIFSKGGVKGWNQHFSVLDEGAKTERKNDKENMLTVLCPNESRKYGIVIGSYGVEKSTLVRQCIFEMKEPKEMVYFLTPAMVVLGFNTQLAKTIGYREPFDPIARARRWLRGKIDPFDKTRLLEPQASWDPIGNKLLDVAEYFYTTYGKPMVLVLDGVDLIAKKNVKFLGDLQNFAKLGADMGVLRFIFISSDGVAVDFLKSKSAISRSMPVVEIIEIDDQLAIEYLCSLPEIQKKEKTKGRFASVIAYLFPREGEKKAQEGEKKAQEGEKKRMSRDQAKLAVEEITGGSFTKMQDYHTQWKMNIPHEEIWENHVRKLEGAFKRIQIESNHKIFLELVAVDPIPGFVNEAVALGLFEGGERQKLKELVEENILSVHPKGGYRFNNRFVKTYFVKNKKQENKK
jgi:hypothetical protein